jgi:hypothetical protein
MDHIIFVVTKFGQGLVKTSPVVIKIRAAGVPSVQAGFWKLLALGVKTETRDMTKSISR